MSQLNLDIINQDPEFFSSRLVTVDEIVDLPLESRDKTGIHALETRRISSTP